MSSRVQRMMTQPINLIFRHLQQKRRVQLHLMESKDMRLEGQIIGFDEYMNVVLEDAEEVYVKKAFRKQLGRIMLKGENIVMIVPAQSQS